MSKTNKHNRLKIQKPKYVKQMTKYITKKHSTFATDY